MSLSHDYLLLFYFVLAQLLVIYFWNIKGLIDNVKEIKEKGETPLTTRSAIGVVLSFIVEALTSFLVIAALDTVVDLSLNVFVTIGAVILVTILRNLVAYLVMYGYWDIIVKSTEKKVKQELLQEIGEE
ncbi:hypothetical protein FP74_gp170 [Bacillus phage CAM003]|uniref:Uncharacterized protein n=2 Tax=Bastillevirus CAM003 TaxID=1918012 RepID=A0A024B0E1_9CAUD|nr:hypothetical protein FP74_gp170 [Bacillus phage CAM003]AHZ09626.1 hypothetical protein [Bacillus phage CAM003]ASU01042.1 hypothetical protein ANTHONY_202 [Bacillus phage Anthony]